MLLSQHTFPTFRATIVHNQSVFLFSLFDIEHFLLVKCETKEETQRVLMELEMFRERGMEMILVLMVYLVEFMEDNDIVWGVGRGSSVSSFILFLIGIHSINSLQHDLPIEEFLR